MSSELGTDVMPVKEKREGRRTKQYRSPRRIHAAEESWS